MSQHTEIIAKIKADIETLEGSDLDEFDMVDGVTAILVDAVDLIQQRYDHPRLKALQDDEDPAFDRFASRMKNSLETQQNYLSSLSELFTTEPDLVSEKLTKAQGKINKIIKDERLLFQQSSALFEKEEEIRTRKKRLDALLAKKTELEAIQKRLAKHDVNALSREVETIAENNQKTQAELVPLRERRERLQSEYETLQEAMDNLRSSMERLEDAHGTQAAEITRQLPQWIDALKARADERERKDQQYVQELEQETRRLEAVETRLQERLQDIERFIDAAETGEDILRAHFEANSGIGERFSQSLPQRREEIEIFQTDIANQLRQFDALLREMQARLEEIAVERGAISV